MSALTIFAGPTAMQRIQREGLGPEQFRVMVGASGGPKWFVLYGLDRYLFGEFFAGRRAPLITLGSSAGAWRICCLALGDPVAAIDRLALLYSSERYSAQPTVDEITSKARDMLAKVLGESGAREIAHNPVFKTHIVVARSRGPGASNQKLIQASALGLSAIANAASRRSLSLFYQRTVFHNMGDLSPWGNLSDISSVSAALTEENVQQAMIASGSIPFVLEGVRDIPGAPPGMYFDGGIIDYHFDQPFHEGAELVLYPHFSPTVIPGWFDKHLPWRKVNPRHFHNVVLLTPSADFVSSLPHGKIPDRKDFERFDYDTRMAVWKEVLERSHEIASAFRGIVEGDLSAAQLRPLVGPMR